MHRFWEDVIPAEDKAAYDASGYGKPVELGQRPVLLVVDCTYNFCGDRPEPILDSIARFPNSCGPVAWEAMPHIQRVLAAARTRGVPVLYTRGPLLKNALTLGGWGRTSSRHLEGEDPWETIPDPIAPLPGEVVLEKLNPSAFFGTPLLGMLTQLQADSLLVAGTTTSGCVRATVVDGFSIGYRMGVVAEATFDRSQISHKVNLYDMSKKYANVMHTEDAVRYLGG